MPPMWTIPPMRLWCLGMIQLPVRAALRARVARNQPVRHRRTYAGTGLGILP
jgi:hypothetical protein